MNTLMCLVCILCMHPVVTFSWLQSIVDYPTAIIINPRRACAERVKVVVSCVCVCLYVLTHAILAVRAIRSITKDAIVLSVRFAAILKWRFP